VVALDSPGLQVLIYYQRNTGNEANEHLDGSKQREVRVDNTYFVGMKGDHQAIDRKTICCCVHAQNCARFRLHFYVVEPGDGDIIHLGTGREIILEGLTRNSTREVTDQLLRW
jgi:hypothetical protein